MIIISHTQLVFSAFILFGAIFIVYFYQRNKLHTLKRLTDELYHDINSSLVIVKLTVDSLKDFTSQDTNSSSIEPIKLRSLINLLEDGVSEIESSFRNWNIK